MVLKTYYEAVDSSTEEVKKFYSFNNLKKFINEDKRVRFVGKTIIRKRKLNLRIQGYVFLYKNGKLSIKF